MNKNADLSALDVEELVNRFEEIGVKQYNAEVDDNIAYYNRLMDKMMEVDRELRRRGLDARRALVALFDHPNIQVRLQAATLSLAVAPEAARFTLQKIFDSKSYPQAANAGLSFLLLERGTLKPD